MKINNRFGASPLSFIMMMAVACVTFSQVLPASAQDTWQLAKATFQDGGTAMGTFTLNPAGNTITAWNIKVSKDKSNMAYTAYTYTNTNGGFSFTLNNNVNIYSFFNSAFSRGLALVFANPLPTTAGIGQTERLIANPKLFLTSEEQILYPNLQPARFFTSGSVTLIAVPEPGTMASFAFGIATLMSLALIKQIRRDRAALPSC